MSDIENGILRLGPVDRGSTSYTDFPCKKCLECLPYCMGGDNCTEYPYEFNHTKNERRGDYWFRNNCNEYEMETWAFNTIFCCPCQVMGMFSLILLKSRLL